MTTARLASREEAGFRSLVNVAMIFFRGLDNSQLTPPLPFVVVVVVVVVVVQLARFQRVVEE